MSSSNGKINKQTIIADRPATVEHVPSADFFERLAKVYRLLENYLLTQHDPSSILEEKPREGVK
jgi:hypothetical protein